MPSDPCHLQKFSDDSVVVGCITKGDDSLYRDKVSDFVTWRDDNFLELNIRKTKEIVIDFKRNTEQVQSVGFAEHYL